MGFPGSSAGKESTYNEGDPGLITGSGRSLEKEATHSSILGLSCYKICLQCVRPGFDPSVGKTPWRRAWQPTPVFLPGESPWTEEPRGLHTVHGVTKRQTGLSD